MSPAHIVAAVAAVLIAAGATWRRHQLSGERRLIAAALVVVLAVYASGALSALPDPKKAIQDIAQALGAWTYALVGVAAYLETAAFIGLIAPGETIVIAGGVIAGQGEIELIPLIGIVWACATLGDTTSFYIGRRLGRRFLERHGPKVKITHERLEQVERYFDRYGGRTILIGRFIGLVRALAPFVAGSSGLAYRRFIPYSIVGTGLWSTLFCLLGYLFWRSFDKVASIAGHAITGFAVTVGVIVAVVVAYRRRREIRSWLLAHQRHPLLRPLFAIGRPLNRHVVQPIVALVAPPLRFFWNRVTPGQLGLELTTALAVAGVGFYMFALYVVILSGDPGPTPLDRQLLDLGDEIRTQGLTDVVKFVSSLGSLPVCAAIAGLTAALLVAGRRPAEGAAIVLGFVLIYIALHLTKAGVDRPRPPHPLTHTSGSSYPSAHAAYSIAWVAAAFALTRRLGLLGGATLVTAAIVLAAAIGLSRIYLRAHYWSDVAGGWSIGFGIYGALAAILIIVDYIRHNAEMRAAEPAAHAER